MAYSTTTDVASEFKNITISATSALTTTEVTEFIVQADAYIDSRLGLKFTVPITGAESLKIVKRLSIWLVASRMKEIYKVKTGAVLVDQGETGDLGKMAREELDKIIKNELLLSDATLLSSANGVKSFSNDNGEEYTFQRNRDDW